MKTQKSETLLKTNKTLWITLTAVLMGINIALSVVSVPVPGGHLYFNDAVICLSALLLDPLGAFIVGGVGAFLGDFFFYPAPMFVSLVSHGLQAIVIALYSSRLQRSDTVLAALPGLIAGGVIMVCGYTLGRAYVYATPEMAVIKLPYEILQALVGIVFAPLLCYNCGLKAQLRRIINRRAD